MFCWNITLCTKASVLRSAAQAHPSAAIRPHICTLWITVNMKNCMLSHYADIPLSLWLHICTVKSMKYDKQSFSEIDLLIKHPLTAIIALLTLQISTIKQMVLSYSVIVAIIGDERRTIQQKMAFTRRQSVFHFMRKTVLPASVAVVQKQRSSVQGFLLSPPASTWLHRQRKRLASSLCASFSE